MTDPSDDSVGASAPLQTRVADTAITSASDVRSLGTVLVVSYGYDPFDGSVRDGGNDHWLTARRFFAKRGYDLRLANDAPIQSAIRVLFLDVPSAFPYLGVRRQAKRVLATLGGEPSRRHLLIEMLNFIDSASILGRRRNGARTSNLRRWFGLRDIYAECRRAGLVDRTALMLVEAPAAQPDNWRKDVHRRFPRVLTFNTDLLGSNPRYREIFVTSVSDGPVNSSPKSFRQKRLLTTIASNKVSSHPKSLYRQRRDAVEFFQWHAPDQFDLYGQGWNHSEFPSWQGTCSDKFAVLNGYRFCLTYENIDGQPGYITEKIFDALRAGCIPIYLGCTNVTDYVDADAFIDRRSFANDGDLLDYLMNVDERRYREYQYAVDRYLTSDRFRRLGSEGFARALFEGLDL